MICGDRRGIKARTVSMTRGGALFWAILSYGAECCAVQGEQRGVKHKVAYTETRARRKLYAKRVAAALLSWLAKQAAHGS